MAKIDEKQFVEWYEKYADAIYRHIYFRIGNPELAQEFLQETFMKTWEYCQSRQVTHIKAFLYKVATNLIIDTARKNSQVQVYSLDQLKDELGFDPSIEDSSNEVEIRIASQNIHQVLQKLEKNDQDLIVLRYIDELQPKEIAEILGLSANVVSVRLHRAVKKLQEILNNQQ